LVRTIIAAPPATYLSALDDDELDFAVVTALHLITHLLTKYGTITATDRDTNLANMTRPWSPPQLIEELFKQLDHGSRLAALAQEPIANSQLARMGQTMLLKAGLFT
jgi:hypothetical protein